MTTINGYDGSLYATNHIAGWLFSVLLHASLIVGGLIFLQRIRLVPDLKPFMWNVTMVSSTVQLTASSSALIASPLPSQVRTTTPTAATSFIPSARPTVTKSSTQSEQQPVTPVPQALPVPSPPATIFSGPDPAMSLMKKVPPAQRETEPSPPASLDTPTTPDRSPVNHILTTIPLSEGPTSSAPSLSQVAAIPPTFKATSVDYSWLSEAILRRVEELKRYPSKARADHAEGKVVVKAVVNEDGSIDNVEIFQSSGFPILDQAASDLIRHAGPFSLPYPLGKSRIAIKIPMSYRLDR